jgi:hypothetical protein
MKMTIKQHNKVMGFLMDMQDVMDELGIPPNEMKPKDAKKMRSVANKLANSMVAAGLLESMGGKFI